MILVGVILVLVAARSVIFARVDGTPAETLERVWELMSTRLS